MVRTVALRDAAKGEYKIWPNGLGADCGNWEILFPVNPLQPYRARWYEHKGDTCPCLYGEGKDVDAAIDSAELY